MNSDLLYFWCTVFLLSVQYGSRHLDTASDLLPPTGVTCSLTVCVEGANENLWHCSTNQI